MANERDTMIERNTDAEVEMPFGASWDMHRMDLGDLVCVEPNRFGRVTELDYVKRRFRVSLEWDPPRPGSVWRALQHG